MRRFVVLAGVSMLAGCSLFVSLDDLSSGEDAMASWHRVEFEVDFAKSVADLRIDGTEAVHRDFDSPDWTSATAAAVGFGMVATIGGDMFFDNVTITKE